MFFHISSPKHMLWVLIRSILLRFCLFVLRFYGPVNPIGSCRVPSIYLTTHLLGRLSPLSGSPVLCTFFCQILTTMLRCFKWEPKTFFRGEIWKMSMLFAWKKCLLLNYVKSIWSGAMWMWQWNLENNQPASVAHLDAPSDWRPGGRGFSPRRGRQHSFVEIDHEIFSTVILSLPLIQEGQLSVSGERMCTILVNRLED